MTNNEARKVLQEVWRNERTDYESVEVKEAIDRAIRSLKDVDRLEDENHENFVNSQHIISILLEDNKKLRESKLANDVWKLYEKYQSHLATSVIEFGDELKELLGKYQKGSGISDNCSNC